jgi:predicted dehydrogenase
MQVDALVAGGGELVSFYAEEAELCAQFQKKYPGARKARSTDEILEDSSIQLVTSASIPNERADLGILVMRNGKDFLVDKPGVTTMDQLDDVKKVQRETGRIYSIFYAERFASPSVIRAGELIRGGAIGRVIQTIGLGPHTLDPKNRPDWFFKKERYGGILADIGTHQIDQFLYFTSMRHAEVVSSQVANFNHPHWPELEDFGDLILSGEGCTGYARVDWFTPAGLGAWGDGRNIILGTDGFIELRKSIDMAGREGGDHLFLADKKRVQYIDCRDVELTFGRRLGEDILNRTETLMTQDHCFLVAQLALEAQIKARRIA